LLKFIIQRQSFVWRLEASNSVVTTVGGIVPMWAILRSKGAIAGKNNTKVGNVQPLSQIDHGVNDN